MATTPMSRVVSHLRRVALLREADRLTDAQLLEFFLVRGEDAAFEALVRRHGPMIFGVCRRVLHDRHDAEDAFQATFLVLLRKAAGISKRGLLANWLYGVAHRTALKAHRSSARRRAKERQVEAMAQKQVTRDDAIQDMLPLLDQELTRLPDKYRVPIILCDLQGKTRKKAAEQLGLPEETFSTRLTRARAMLAKRLARHGTAISGTAVALAVSQNMASASVPPSLVASTVKIGALVVAGKTGVAGVMSAKVAALAEGVVRMMLLTKLKTMVALVVMVGALGVGAGISVTVHDHQTQAAEPATAQKAKAPKDERPSPDTLKKEHAKSDQERIQGSWCFEKAEMNGVEVPFVRGRLAVFVGDKLTTDFHFMETKGMSFKLDPSTKQKSINLHPLEDANQTWLGIYQLDGDDLKICFCGKGKQERPTAMTDYWKAGSYTVLIVLKRQNGPAEKTEGQAKEPPKEFTNSLGMKFVWIPPGSFMMGSPVEEKGRIDDEVLHKVTLSNGFYMGVYLVTQEQWQAVMGENPSTYKGDKNLPVEKVSWDDCQEFIKRLRDKDKEQYRLPTEAEWEYSCRAGTTTPFYFGETISTEQANYNGDFPYWNGKKGENRKKTTPVGRFPANAFGLYDMHGNVGQWCQDWCGEYLKDEVVDPQGPADGERRVWRGGTFMLRAMGVRSAHRLGNLPTLRSTNLGFRVARTFTLDEAKQGARPAKDAKEGQKHVDGSKQRQVQAVQKQEDLEKNEMAALEGTWKVVLYEKNGEIIERNGEKATPYTWIEIKGNKFTITQNRSTLQSKIKINPTMKPKWFDVTPDPTLGFPELHNGLIIEDKSHLLPILWQGIYELKNDELKICFDSTGVLKRPSEFKTAPKSGLGLFILKREKKPPEPGAKEPPKEFTNSIGMKFVWIPPGSFMMGSPKEEKERRAEEDQHKVTLTKGFYTGVYTVTQEQWHAVMGNNPSYFNGEKNLPVEQVSWDDCQEFIKRIATITEVIHKAGLIVLAKGKTVDEPNGFMVSSNFGSDIHGFW